MSDVEESVKNFSECLQNVVERVERLESLHGIQSTPLVIPHAATRVEGTSVDPSSGSGSAHYVEVNGLAAEDAIKNAVVESNETPVEVQTVTTTSKENKTGPDGAEKQVTRTVTTSVVKSATYQRAIIPQQQDGPSGPEVTSGLSYMDENRPFELYRLICVKKEKNPPDLGLIARDNNGKVVLAKVADGTNISKNGLLRAGDVIVEINGKPVRSCHEFDSMVRNSPETLTFKIIPTRSDIDYDAKAWYKVNFDYNPSSDSAQKNKNIGLNFKAGDILEILDDSDKDWWQAKRAEDNSRIGFVPSGTVISRRKGSYDEVGKMSPYGRRVLLLLGAAGVGRRTLKGRLLRHDPQQFATVVPCTSRTPRHGEVDTCDYVFLGKDKMNGDIQNGQYLEWGEFKGNYYGTTLDSVRDVVKTGRVCVLDCSPQAIRYLYNMEFMPYVVFVTPPPLEELRQLYSSVLVNSVKRKTEEELSRTCEESLQLEATHRQYFDLVLVNRNSEVTFRRLMDALEAIKTQPQWVPISWLQNK